MLALVISRLSGDDEEEEVGGITMTIMTIIITITMTIITITITMTITTITMTVAIKDRGNN